MGIKSNLPGWHLDHLLGTFAADATILVESICLIFGGFENASPLAISLLTNGSAVVLAGYSGPESSPAAFVCICLTSVFLLYGMVTTFGTQGTYDGSYSGTYPILCSVAHLSYTSVWLYKRMDGRHDSNPGQEVEKKVDLTANSHFEKTLNRKPGTALANRDIVYQFGKAFRMRGTDLFEVTIGTAVIYRALALNTGVGIIFAFLSGLMSALLLFLIDFTRHRDRGVEMDKALQRLVRVLFPVGFFCYVFFTIAELGIDITWWRVAFPVIWFPWLVHTLFLYYKLMSRSAGPRGDPDVGPLGDSRQSSSPGEPSVAVVESGPSLEEEWNETKFHFRRRKDPDTIERHWLNGQPWIQISPRTFVLLLIGCFIIGSPALYITSDFCKAAAFYLVVGFTLACRGHSPVEGSPELMFVHVKYSFVDWRLAVGALTATAVVHLFLLTPVIKSLCSFCVPVACVFMVHLLLPVFSKVPDKDEVDSTMARTVNTTKIDDIESQASKTCAGPASIDRTLVDSSSKIRNLDLRILAMGLSITILDFVINAESTGWPKTTLVSSFTTAIMLMLAAGVPSGRELEPRFLYVLTVALFACFNHYNPLGMFYLYAEDIQDSGDQSLFVKAAIFFALFGAMIANNRRMVMRQEEHEWPTPHGIETITNSLLINVDIGRFGLDYKWQLRHAQVTIVLFLAFISSCSTEQWPLPLNTTIASLGIFLMIVGSQVRPTRIGEETISIAHLLALGICSATTVSAATLRHFGFIEHWTQWHVVACTAMVAYDFPLIWIPRHGRLRGFLSEVPGLDADNDRPGEGSQEKGEGSQTKQPASSSPAEKGETAVCSELRTHTSHQ